jgi:hypothetical protein
VTRQCQLTGEAVSNQPASSVRCPRQTPTCQRQGGGPLRTHSSPRHPNTPAGVWDTGVRWARLQLPAPTHSHPYVPSSCTLLLHCGWGPLASQGEAPHPSTIARSTPRGVWDSCACPYHQCTACAWEQVYRAVGLPVVVASPSGTHTTASSQETAG